MLCWNWYWNGIVRFSFTYLKWTTYMLLFDLHKQTRCTRTANILTWVGKELYPIIYIWLPVNAWYSKQLVTSWADICRRKSLSLERRFSTLLHNFWCTTSYVHHILSRLNVFPSLHLQTWSTLLMLPTWRHCMFARVSKRHDICQHVATFNQFLQ